MPNQKQDCSPEQARQSLPGAANLSSNPVRTANNVSPSFGQSKCDQIDDAILVRLASACQQLQGLRKEKVVIGPCETLEENWREISKTFDICKLYVENFVRLLPGYSSINEFDRETLLRDGLFSIALLELSLDYNLETGKENFFGMNDASAERYLSKINHGVEVRRGIQMAGQTVAKANLSPFEVQILAALLFFNSGNPLLMDPENVREIEQQYSRAAERSLTRDHGKEAAKCRLDQLRSLVGFFVAGEKKHAEHRLALTKQYPFSVLKESNPDYYNFYQLEKLKQKYFSQIL